MTSDLDLELFNKVFKREVLFDEGDVCDKCGRNRCECCGEETYCGTDPYLCAIVKKAKKEHISIREEDFSIEDYLGYRAAINCNRIMLIISGDIPVSYFSNKLNCKYIQTKPIRFQSRVLSFDHSPSCYLLPYGIHVKKGSNCYPKIQIDCALNFLKSPEIYYAYDVPLIIRNDKYTVMLAPRVFFEDAEDEN